MTSTSKFALFFTVYAALAASSTAFAQNTGKVECTILENASAASGTIELKGSDGELISGSCGGPVSAPAGKYSVELRLDGALDHPKKTSTVEVKSGETSQLKADFSTGILQIQAQEGERRVAAMATVYRGTSRVGSLGMGVTAHLSTGSYDVVVRYRSKEKRFSGVTLSAQQKRVLNAAF